MWIRKLRSEVFRIGAFSVVSDSPQSFFTFRDCLQSQFMAILAISRKDLSFSRYPRQSFFLVLILIYFKNFLCVSFGSLQKLSSVKPLNHGIKTLSISLIGQRKPFAILGVSRLGHFHQCVPGLPPLSQMPLDWLSNVLSSSESSLSMVVISDAHPTHIFQSALPTVTQGLRIATVTANVSPAVTQDTYM